MAPSPPPRPHTLAPSPHQLQRPWSPACTTTAAPVAHPPTPRQHPGGRPPGRRWRKDVQLQSSYWLGLWLGRWGIPQTKTGPDRDLHPPASRKYTIAGPPQQQHPTRAASDQRDLWRSITGYADERDPGLSANSTVEQKTMGWRSSPRDDLPPPPPPARRGQSIDDRRGSRRVADRPPSTPPRRAVTAARTSAQANGQGRWGTGQAPRATGALSIVPLCSLPPPPTSAAQLQTIPPTGGGPPPRDRNVAAPVSGGAAAAHARFPPHPPARRPGHLAARGLGPWPNGDPPKVPANLLSADVQKKEREGADRSETQRRSPAGLVKYGRPGRKGGGGQSTRHGRPTGRAEAVADGRFCRDPPGSPSRVSSPPPPPPPHHQLAPGPWLQAPCLSRTRRQRIRWCFIDTTIYPPPLRLAPLTSRHIRLYCTSPPLPT